MFTRIHWLTGNVSPRRIAIYLAIFLLASSAATAADYFVSLTGDDGNPGTRTQPWRTIQKAADSLRAGDTVHVRGGEYTEHVVIRRSGSMARPIVFQAAVANTAVIKSGSFFGNNQSHIRIEGFHVVDTSGSRSAIEFKGNGCCVEIINNEISRMRSQSAAIRVGGTMHHFLIDRNHIHHNHTGNQEAVRVHERTSDFKVTRNEVNDNSNIGIDIVGWSRYGKPKNGVVSHNYCHNNSTAAPWAAEIYLDGPENIVVEHNVVTGSEYGFQLGCEPATDSSSGNILRHNVAYDCTKAGLIIGGFTGGTVHDCIIHNNTFVENSHGIVFNRNAGHRNTIINNILYEPRGQSIGYNGRPRNTIIDFNCYFVSRGETPGDNSIITNPQFRSIEERDLMLKPTSPCIAKGTKTRANGQISSVADVDDETAPDIGASGLVNVIR